MIIGTIRGIFSFFGSIISIIGIVIVVVGVMRSGLLLFSSFTSITDEKLDLYKQVRFNLANYILLGLEFMVASDVMESVFVHNSESTMTLVVFVLVRTILAYSLEREIAQS